MGNNECHFENDTEHSVTIHDYDGKRKLHPGGRQYNYLAQGPYYVNLIMTFPNGRTSTVSVYGSEYQNRTHFMSAKFDVDIRRYEQEVREEQRREEQRKEEQRREEQRKEEQRRRDELRREKQTTGADPGEVKWGAGHPHYYNGEY